MGLYEFVLLAMFCGVLAPLAAADVPRGPTLEAGADRVLMTTGGQRLVFTRGSAGFAVSTFVRDGASWRPGFEAGLPLLIGSLFGDLPSTVRVIAGVCCRVSRRG
jgi:hypothetical protein